MGVGVVVGVGVGVGVSVGVGVGAAVWAGVIEVVGDVGVRVGVDVIELKVHLQKPETNEISKGLSQKEFPTVSAHQPISEPVGQLPE